MTYGSRWKVSLAILAEKAGKEPMTPDTHLGQRLYMQGTRKLREVGNLCGQHQHKEEGLFKLLFH